MPQHLNPRTSGQDVPGNIQSKQRLTNLSSEVTTSVVCPEKTLPLSYFKHSWKSAFSAWFLHLTQQTRNISGISFFIGSL
jgi:hypothetical protein